MKKTNKNDKYFKLLNQAHTFFSTRDIHNAFGLPIKSNYFDKNCLKKSPNKSLFLDNTIYKENKENNIYFAHLTTNSSYIIKNKKIFCSSGCLVGSIYCVPVYFNKKNKIFSLHNIGDYIFTKEISFFSKTKEKPKILLFEIKNKKENKKTGLNYLKLGEFHLEVFNELKFLLNKKELEELNKEVLLSIESSKEFIFILNKYNLNEINSFFDKFFNLYRSKIKKVPIFGYFLFEIISEYIVLYQNDKKSIELAKIKEINVENFKKIVFSVVPDITKNFNLGNFNPSLKDLNKYFNKSGLEFDLFKKYFLHSLSFYIKNYLFDGKINKNFFEDNNNLEKYKSSCPAFVGHIIHRIIRKMNRYPDFSINFDTYKAIKIWNFWNENSTLFLYNSLIPKGEFGINPAFPNMDYKIYLGDFVKIKNNKVFFKKGKKLDIKITPQLMSINNLLMRRKNE